MTTLFRRSALPVLLLALVGCTSLKTEALTSEPTGPRVHFLEIVTPEVDATCATYAQVHGVTFGDPVPEFGNARTADLAGGGIISVRAPMRATEAPLVRAYLLVDDIEAATQAASDAGAKIAMPPMEIAGQGKFAIYLLGGIDHALWQL